MTDTVIAVIFDMDGVLVDNAEFHTRAFSEYFESFGIRLTPEMFGRGNRELMSELFPDEKSEEKLSEFAAGKEAYYRKIFAPHMKPLAGLIDLLKSLKENNIPAAVGSSAPDINIDFVLDGLDIRQYFTLTVGSAAVERAKPAPDIYLKISELLKIPPAKCVVFEDAVAGIEAAKAAEMKVVGIATSLPADELAGLKTNKTIRDFTEITVDDLKKLVKS